MKAKEIIPASKPRNFVAKNQKTAGAGAHKDKKKAEKQGNVKHKLKQFEDAEPMDREFSLVKKLGRLGERIVQNPKLWDRYEEENNSGDPDWIISLIQDGTGATFDEVLKLSDLFSEIGGGMGRIIDFAWAVKEGTWEEDFMDPYRKHRDQDVEEGVFGIDSRTKGAIQNVVSQLSDIPGMWDHAAQTFTSDGLEKLKSLLKDNPKHIKYAVNLKADDYDESINMERYRDPEDWDEGNTEPPNNFAVYINGKKWKVFAGRGTYADDERERKQYYDLRAWAQRKSDATGKKWTVSITGEPPTA